MRTSKCKIQSCRHINIRQGIITFWTKENQINWSGNDIVIFFEKSFEGNSILILKDSDAKLKFFHVYFGRGRTDVELDVGSLNNNEKHFIAATWSVEKEEIALYVDGNKLVKSQKIK